MKFNQVLLRQHIGRYLKKHWMMQGKKTIRDSVVFKQIENRNIPIIEANDVIKEHTFEKVEVISLAPEPIKFDETHPDWKQRTCHTYKDNNVLLEGFRQAQRLTKTVEIQNGLPQRYVIKNSSKELDARVKNIVLYSHILDAAQEKLAKIKDPERPAFNFPRVYGVPMERRMILLTSKLLQLVESMSGPQLSNARYVFNNLSFKFSFEREGDLIQMDLSADTFLTSLTPLKSLTQSLAEEAQLPVLQPLKDTITLNFDNIYSCEDIYPISKRISKRHPHTLFIHFDPEKVKNIYGEEVTEEQILGRNLMKAFTAAASYARQEFGNDVKALPKPVVIQCVQTDGRLFHFAVLQLNTLDLKTLDGTRNIWYQTARMPMFDICAYVNGKPTLEGYNSDVIKHLLSFYMNV